MVLPRRFLARVLVVCALALTPLAVAGCGGHHLLSKAFCLYNVDRAFHDFRTGHKIYGALNVALAIHNCERGFGRNH